MFDSDTFLDSSCTDLYNKSRITEGLGLVSVERPISSISVKKRGADNAQMQLTFNRWRLCLLGSMPTQLVGF